MKELDKASSKSIDTAIDIIGGTQPVPTAG